MLLGWVFLPVYIVAGVSIGYMNCASKTKAFLSFPFSDLHDARILVSSLWR
jgi:hypothetical protein